MIISSITFYVSRFTFEYPQRKEFTRLIFGDGMKEPTLGIVEAHVTSGGFYDNI